MMMTTFFSSSRTLIRRNQLMSILTKRCCSGGKHPSMPPVVGAIPGEGTSAWREEKPAPTHVMPALRLPDPTWSMRMMHSSRQPLASPVSREELDELARRALIQIEALPPAVVKGLQQDLGNLIHLIQQMQSFPAEKFLLKENEGGVDRDWDEVDIYDVPRGVSACPLRLDSPEAEATEAAQVWQSFLAPHTTPVGGHAYFVVATHHQQVQPPRETEVAVHHRNNTAFNDHQDE